MTSILSQIHFPSDLKKRSMAELIQLAQEIRSHIIHTVATKEGHLGASLGVVELTIALHYVFDTPDDKIIWDVGHQAYGHKLLTGRQAVFDTNRQYQGISGFPSRAESEYDAFGVGHSSTAISAALGMALAAQLKGADQRTHIAVVGDASIAAGMAFEGLNHAGDTSANLLVILNDNAIGIDPSVGALKPYWATLKSENKDADNVVLQALGFATYGPVDGHQLPELISVLQELKKNRGPRFLHVTTTKGKGLKQAEQNQVLYHAPGKFNQTTGELHPQKEQVLPKYQDVFGWTLLELAQHNEKIIGITPAMPTGSSLKYFMDTFPQRAIDVGIAEQHAVTLAAGMAAEGFVVFCTIYSTFLQRAYDQIIHDVALQNLPVIFCVDRAGLVGEDGATHQGVFDISFLQVVPNLQILAPKDAIELRNTLYTLQLGVDHPVALRYPRGFATQKNWQVPFEVLTFDKVNCLKDGTSIAVLCTGTLQENVLKALEIDVHQHFAVYHFIQIKPLNEQFLHDLSQSFHHWITIEEGSVIGGFGSRVAQWVTQSKYNIHVTHLGVPDAFIDHATVLQQQKMCGLDADSLQTYFFNMLKHEL